MNYTQQEIDILKKYYPEGGCDEVQKYIKRTNDSIRHKSQSLGVTRTEGFHFSKLNFDDFIINISPQSAYILGIIWGDGCVQWESNQRRYSIRLTIKESDFDNIKNMFDRFTVYKAPKRKESWKQCIIACVNHKIFATFLKENDYLIKSHASPDKILSKIPDNLKHYFFRGWFDADGSNNGLLKGIYVLIMAGSFNQDWNALESVCENLDINYKIRRVINPNGNKYSTLSFYQYNQVLKFRDYLYQGEQYGLKRKRDNFFNIRLPIRWKSIKP